MFVVFISLLFALIELDCFVSTEAILDFSADVALDQVWAVANTRKRRPSGTIPVFPNHDAAHSGGSVRAVEYQLGEPARRAKCRIVSHSLCGSEGERFTKLIFDGATVPRS